MPSIPNISFSARFDLTGVPTLIITDTSTNGLTSTRVASFDITQPDLYTRTGNILSPDMAAGVTTFSIVLRLDSNGLPQCGTYNIVMTVKNTGYDDTTFTRNWVSQYIPVTLSIDNNFDTFTPNLSVTDITNYSVSNYNSGAITRAWSIASAATGTLTGSGVTKSFIYNGNYYESNYTISLTSSLLYTHQVYTWFTVNESINKTYTACIDAPPNIVELVAAISELKLELDNAINTCQTYDHIKADFEFAETLLMHIIDKIRTNDMNNIFTDLNDLLSILDNHQIPACNPTNIIIPPYDLSLYSNVQWGDIGGNIVNQTDVNLHTVTTNGSVTTNKITVGGVGLTGMTAGTGALYYNAAGNRVTVANYNAGGYVYFEVNAGQYTMILNPDLSVRLLGYPTNGFLKTSNSNGTLVVDTANYVPTTRILTINGTSYDLSADRSWTITSMIYPPAGIAVSTGTAWGTSIVDNSANWNDAYTYRITSATSPLSITSNAISISQSGVSSDGYLSSIDWNVFNNKFNLPVLTNGSVIFSNGTTLAEDNANFFWNDTTNRLGIGLAGATTPKSTLHVGPWSVHSDLGTSSVRIGATLGGSNTVVNALHLDSDPSTLSYSQGLALTFGLHNTSFGEYTSRIVHYGYNTFVRSSRLQIQTHSSATGVWNNGIFIDENGRVGINTTAPSFGLDVSGTTRITSTVTLSNLAGTGTRMVVASATGVLSTQSISTGTVTSVDMSVPIGFSISGNPITSSGTLAVSFAAGYSLPTTTKQSEWDSAYNDKINSASVTGTSTKTLTLNQQDGGTVTASWDDIDTGLTSVGLSMPNAFLVSNTPLTSNGTIAVTGAGTATQYIRGDGQLATFPSTASGGSSINYYLNGSIPSSVVGYQQMDNNAVVGGGTDFTLVGNGLIAQFLTDVGNPNRIQIPGGAWNFEMYFQVSSSGGNQKFYIELHKYDGSTFTLIASSVLVPEEITGGTSTDLYLTSLAVPTTTLLTTDRLAVRVYIVDNAVGRTITLHTENTTLCEIITTFAGGIASLNGLTANTQYLAVGTSGTDFNINSLVDTHTFNLPTASATNRGALSTADWSTFNSKVGGTGVAGQVAYWSGTNTQTGSATFTFSPTSQLLVNNSVTAESAIARGALVSSTLVAAANNDVLVGLDIDSTFTNGGFTGLKNYSIRTNSSNVQIGTIGAATGQFRIDGVNSADYSFSVYSSNVLRFGITGFGGVTTNNNTLDCGTSFISAATARFGGVGANSTIDLRSTAGVNPASFKISNGSTAFYINTNGRVLVNTTIDAGYVFDVNGTARVQGKLSVNTPTAASAVMEITSTTQGFLPPRMTNAQRTAIATPAVGLVVYCTDSVEGLYVYTSLGWKSLTMV